MTVGQLLASMSAREFTEWMAFDSLEPFGDQRADLRAGIVAATVVNSNPWRKKGSRAARPSDFMLVNQGERRPAMHPEAQMMLCRALTMLAGGQVIEGGQPQGVPTRPRKA